MTFCAGSAGNGVTVVQGSLLLLRKELLSSGTCWSWNLRNTLLQTEKYNLDWNLLVRAGASWSWNHGSRERAISVPQSRRPRQEKPIQSGTNSQSRGYLNICNLLAAVYVDEVTMPRVICKLRWSSQNWCQHNDHKYWRCLVLPFCESRFDTQEENLENSLKAFSTFAKLRCLGPVEDGPRLHNLKWARKLAASPLQLIQRWRWGVLLCVLKLLPFDDAKSHWLHSTSKLLQPFPR